MYAMGYIFVDVAFLNLGYYYCCSALTSPKDWVKINAAMLRIAVSPHHYNWRSLVMEMEIVGPHSRTPMRIEVVKELGVSFTTPEMHVREFLVIPDC